MQPHLRHRCRGYWVPTPLCKIPHYLLMNRFPDRYIVQSLEKLFAKFGSEIWCSMFGWMGSELMWWFMAFGDVVSIEPFAVSSTFSISMLPWRISSRSSRLSMSELLIHRLALSVVKPVRNDGRRLQTVSRIMLNSVAGGFVQYADRRSV